MDASPCIFHNFRGKNVPHILEKIFFFLDFKSFKACQKVNREWRDLLTSERFMTKANSVFKKVIREYNMKLTVAAGKDNTENIRTLLSSGMVHINCRDTYYTRFTPLHEASYRGIKDNVRLLLELGADPNVSDCWGNRPLHGAAQIGSKEVAQILINGGANVNAATTVLLDAVKSGHYEVAELLIESGFNVNGVTGNISPLHVAVEGYCKDSVKFLIENGADPNVADSDGLTPLQWIAKDGQNENEDLPTEMARLLIEGGAELNIANEDGATPLHLVVETGNLKLTKLLIDNGAELNVTDGNERTPLHFAVEAGAEVEDEEGYEEEEDDLIQVAQLLIDRGADIDERARRSNMFRFSKVQFFAVQVDPNKFCR